MIEQRPQIEMSPNISGATLEEENALFKAPEALRRKQLLGKVAIITGVSRPNGIGAAIADLFADEGIEGVVINSTEKTRDMALARVAELEAKGVKALWYGGDIAQKKTCEEIVKLTKKEFGRVDILVHNAGVTMDKPFPSVTEEDLDYVLGVNLKGAFFLAQEAFSARPKNSEDGLSIVVIGSPIGEEGNRGSSAYGISKMADEGLVAAIVQDLGVRGIRANLVKPGFTDTDLAALDNDTARQMIIDATPLGKLPTTRQSAQAVLFFASPASAGITGQELQVSGGLDGGIRAIQPLVRKNYQPVAKEKSVSE